MTQVSVFSSTFNPATFSELALHKRQITKFQLTTFFLSLYAHNNAPKNYTSTAKTKSKCWRWKCQNWTTCCDSVLRINPRIHQWYLVWLWYSTNRRQQTDEAFTSDTWYDCDILQTAHNRQMKHSPVILGMIVIFYKAHTTDRWSIHQWYLVWLWYSTNHTQQTDEAFTSDTWYDCDILQTKHNREKMKWIHYTETQLFTH